ncbi:MAG TPA: glycosyltransferase family 2 protein [Acidimicrobiales bacterium]|nr:glycosyltransferase family 2 protein [Acidimicrobiales bacterium]
MADPARLGMRDAADRVLKVVPAPGPAPTDRPDRGMDLLPDVTVALPVLNEAPYLDGCLQAVVEQTYPRIVEILVVDGGSEDRTREIAARFPGVRIVHNPARFQSAGLNLALREARGDILVRVDGRTVVAPDYVDQCVTALTRSGAALVGGPLEPRGTTWVERAIGAALTSTLGAGPARFRNADSLAAWTDMVYLGAARVDVLRRLGGYDEGFATNEDGELLHRLGHDGGVWFDPAIRSTYRPRDSFVGFMRQYYRYGAGRAGTVRKYPGSLRLRQLAAPLLVLGLLSPWRRRVARAYLGVVVVASGTEMGRDPAAAAGLAVALPVMHISWGVGFLVGWSRRYLASR